MSSKIFARLNDLPFVKTSHQVGFKKVIFNSNDFESDVTQLAFGELLTNQHIDSHMHESMEEIFIFISGTGIITINHIDYEIRNDSIYRIPIKTEHSIKALSDLNFYYFGVALNY
jgi:mannose-6-phosphate isomerase-like protein (cupin superfamily)